MTLRAKTRAVGRSATDLDEERKRATANLRTARSVGQKNLLLGFKVRDSRAEIDSPALGCGLADILDEILRSPKKTAAALERGEKIYSGFQGARPRGAGETILHLDPTKAEKVAVRLAGAGLKPGPRQAGWATFRGGIARDAVQSLLDDFGFAAADYRLHEIESYVPPATETPSAPVEAADPDKSDAAATAEPSASSAEEIETDGKNGTAVEASALSTNPDGVGAAEADVTIDASLDHRLVGAEPELEPEQDDTEASRDEDALPSRAASLSSESELTLDMKDFMAK